MKKYNSLVKKVNLFEGLAIYGSRKRFLQSLAQNVDESPFSMKSEKELYGDGSDKKNIESPNEYLTNLMRDSHTKYNTLTPEEQKAVDWWIGSSDSIKNPSGASTPLSQKFNETISKFYIDNPTEKYPLIKRFHASGAEIAKIIRDGEITLQNDTSTSYKSLDKFGPNELIFRNVSRAASLLGPNFHEAEMIIPKGTKFKILNSKPNNKGGYIIELSEIN